ncbi:hypothetical protein DRO64_04560 [Candidatus Bathyarchaeota archaeon]|nr:MAG: hypothetical protein DRO64_04560 [Candidatus Bathyarchaeota archaeon]
MNILLYSPTFYESPGTQARMILLRKSLTKAGFETSILVGREKLLRKLYHYSSRRILTLRSAWKLMGKTISRQITKKNPDAVILFIDVSSSAIPYLKKHNADITVILSIEDLTPEYKEYDEETSRKFYNILIEHASEADIIITPSFTLSEKLLKLGLEAITIPIGLEPYVTLGEALSRSPPPIILHTGQLNSQKQIDTILKLAQKYKMLVHNFGKLSQLLTHPNILKYREITPEKAVSICRRAHMGLIIEYRNAYTLTRYYFHTSLLQPIIVKGRGPWLREAKLLGMTLNPIDNIDEIINKYEHYVRDQFECQKKLSIPFVHSPLINMLKKV